MSAEGLKNAIITNYRSATDGFDKMFGEVTIILAETLELDGKMGMAAYGAIEKLAYQIAAICLLIELAQVASKVDLLKWEHGLKVAVKMALTVVVIKNSMMILKAFYNQGAALVIAAGTSTSSLGQAASNSMTTLVSHIKDDDYGTALLLFMSVLVLTLAIGICGILVKVIAYFRMFEILIYATISPLPCAFFPLGNGDGGGFSRITGKFFKSFAAVCLQGLMIIVCLQIFDTVVSKHIENASTHIHIEINSLDDKDEVVLGWIDTWKLSAELSTLQRKEVGGSTLTAEEAARLKFINENYTYKNFKWHINAVNTDKILRLATQLCFMVLIASIAVVMSVMKCGSWAKSILDAV